MNKQITISDVANYVGVSKSTVSNYLNKKYHHMNEETKSKIQQAVDELGYVPSLSARHLSAKKKNKTIGLIIPGNLSHVFDTMYYPTVFTAVGEISEELGYSVLIYTQNKREEKENMKYLMGLAKSLVDGFLIFDLSPKDRYFKEFEKNAIPYVCVGKIDGYDDYNFVATDHGKGVREALEYLISLGHKKIVLASENKASVVDEVRRNTYKKVMEENNLPFKEKYYYSFQTDGISLKAVEYFEKILHEPDRPTAFAVPANVLHYLKRAVKDNHLYIPEDLSVIALDYYEVYYPEYVRFQNREYTKIKSVVNKVSKKAFQELVKLIEDPEKRFESCLEPVTLEVGRTTGVCRQDE